MSNWLPQKCYQYLVALEFKPVLGGFVKRSPRGRAQVRRHWLRKHPSMFTKETRKAGRDGKE